MPGTPNLVDRQSRSATRRRRQNLEFIFFGPGLVIADMPLSDMLCLRKAERSAQKTIAITHKSCFLSLLKTQGQRNHWSQSAGETVSRRLERKTCFSAKRMQQMGCKRIKHIYFRRAVLMFDRYRLKWRWRSECRIPLLTAIRLVSQRQCSVTEAVSIRAFWPAVKRSYSEWNRL
jgi:hypothetical protein